MTLNYEDAKIEIRKHWRDFSFPLDKSGKGLICPNPKCRSGSGKNGTGLRENPKAKNPGSLKCFSCGNSYDVFDLLQYYKGLNFTSAFDYAATTLHISISKTPVKRPKTPQESFSERDKVNIPNADKCAGKGLETPLPDFAEYYRECAERITDPAAVSYLSARGISLANAEAAHLGFDPAADPANAPGADPTTVKRFPCPRIIIPVTKSHYVGRSIDPNTIAKYSKLDNKGARKSIFNLRAIWNTDVIFVVEGIFDALSIREANPDAADAISLNSVDIAKRFIGVLAKRRSNATFVLCLDGDGAGQTATPILRDGMQKLKIDFVEADICGNEKDPNAALTADREKFISTVKQTANAVLSQRKK